MKLYLFLFLFLVYNEQSLKAKDSANSIRFDQEGYYPYAPKTAIVPGHGSKTRAADFSTLTKSGVFRISVPGCCRSYTFRTEKNVHHPPTVASLKAYLDSEYSYASNEIAINWNTPPVYLSNVLEVLQNKFTNKK